MDFLFSRADALIAVSPYFASRSLYLKKYKDKTVSIPNGIDLEEYQTSFTMTDARKKLGLPDDPPVVLYVGSLIPRKGVDVLLKAMRRVADIHPGRRTGPGRPGADRGNRLPARRKNSG